jgi:hypothetical protein
MLRPRSLSRSGNSSTKGRVDRRDGMRSVSRWDPAEGVRPWVGLTLSHVAAAGEAGHCETKPFGDYSPETDTETSAATGVVSAPLMRAA